jgi:hypothetical protein
MTTEQALIQGFDFFLQRVSPEELIAPSTDATSVCSLGLLFHIFFFPRLTIFACNHCHRNNWTVNPLPLW